MDVGFKFLKSIYLARWRWFYSLYEEKFSKTCQNNMNNSSKITIYFFTLSLHYAIEVCIHKRLQNWWIEYLIILICFTSIRKQWNVRVILRCERGPGAAVKFQAVWWLSWGTLKVIDEKRPRCGGGGGLELKANFRKVFTITEKAPTRAFSWLKGPINTFTFKNLWRHYAKQVLTHG